ncbi:hypothetical protein A2U01_0098476, partial [Trifolium medium]|nr:hypothetical protein [Trifolium medium]
MRRPAAEQLAIAAAPTGIAEGRSGAVSDRSSRDSPLLCFIEYKALFTAEIARSAPLPDL